MLGAWQESIVEIRNGEFIPNRLSRLENTDAGTANSDSPVRYGMAWCL